MRDFSIAPKEQAPATPCLVLIPHLTGIDESMRDAARQFAQVGFAVYIPDLYGRFGAPDPDVDGNPQTFMPYAKQLTTESINTDIDRAVSYLRTAYPEAKIGIIGFCMGGRIAMVRTAGYGDRFQAAAIWYGFAEEIDPKAIDIPVIGSFGADDAHIPADKVRATFEAIEVPHDLKIYDGAGHGFFHKESAYHPKAAADSFERSVGFLKHHLAS